MPIITPTSINQAPKIIIEDPMKHMLFLLSSHNKKEAPSFNALLGQEFFLLSQSSPPLSRRYWSAKHYSDIHLFSNFESYYEAYKADTKVRMHIKSLLTEKGHAHQVLYKRRCPLSKRPFYEHTGEDVWQIIIRHSLASGHAPKPLRHPFSLRSLHLNHEKLDVYGRFHPYIAEQIDESWSQENDVAQALIELGQDHYLSDKEILNIDIKSNTVTLYTKHPHRKAKHTRFLPLSLDSSGVFYIYNGKRHDVPLPDVDVSL